jgi:tetratricopeptide (TPR) repeat protein
MQRWSAPRWSTGVFGSLAPRAGQIVCALIFVAHATAFAQSSSVRLAGVAEPPELLGPPKRLNVESEPDRLFAELVADDWKDREKVKNIRDQLTTFIEAHPDYSDAYFMRALFTRCVIHDGNDADALSDVTRAIATHSAPERRAGFVALPRLYALRARVHFDARRYRDAITDLDTAINQNIRSANQVFNDGGIEPTTSPDPCKWTPADFDALMRRFPTDYRPLLFRGLYFSYFATFNERYATQAVQDFERASALNPKAALPHYFIGNLEAGGAVFPKAIVATATERADASRRTVESLTRAIALDPNLVPALEIRANEYYHLKRYTDTIKDYDRVLALDPDNASAYNDRGLAKMELGQHYAAVRDFNEAIRRKNLEDSTLGLTYQRRAEAYTIVGDFRSAIPDLTKAIERELANTSLLMNVRSFRDLYPEYDGVSDEDLSKKLWMLFWPNLSHEGFAKGFLSGNHDRPLMLNLAELYVRRGDAHLRLGDFRSAVADFSRLFRTVPDYGVERWRALSTAAPVGTVFIDVKTIELPTNGLGRLWTKTTNPTGGYSVQGYDVDCRMRRLNAASLTIYDADGRFLQATDRSSGWQRVIPQTMGEQLYDGLCASSERR